MRSRDIAIFTTVVMLAAGEGAALALDVFSPEDPKRLPTVGERGIPVVMYLPEASIASKFSGLWEIDESEVLQPGPRPASLEKAIRALPSYRFSVWQFCPSSGKAQKDQGLSVLGDDLTMRRHHALGNLEVDDLCRVTLNDSDKWFFGIRSIYHGEGKDRLVGLYEVTGRRIDSSQDQRALIPGFYHARPSLNAIWQAEANADQTITVTDPNRLSVDRVLGLKADLGGLPMIELEALTALQRLLKADDRRDLLVVIFPPFLDGKEQQVLEKIRPLMDTLAYKRTLVLEALPTGWVVLLDEYRDAPTH